MAKLKQTLSFLGLSFGKEMTRYFIGVVAFAGLFALVYLWKGLGFLLIFPSLAFLLYTYWFFTRYGAKRRARLDAYVAEFVELFTYFGVFVNDGFTVYNAIERIVDYASEDMKAHLRRLLEDIDNDKSVAPFVRFAALFEDISIKEVMLSVYRIIDDGTNGLYIRQFQRLFGKLSDVRYAMDKERRLSVLDTMAFLPLAGSGIAMLALTLSLVEIMGGMLDVL